MKKNKFNTPPSSNKKMLLTCLFSLLLIVSSISLSFSQGLIEDSIPLSYTVNFIPPVCQPNSCNYVNNGSFELNANYNHKFNCEHIGPNIGDTLKCWTCTSWTFDTYSDSTFGNTCTGGGPYNTYPSKYFSPPSHPTYLWKTNPDSANNHNFIGIGGWYHDTIFSPSWQYIESVQNVLNHALLPNHKYVLKLKAKVGDSFYVYPYSFLRVMASPYPLPSAPGQGWHNYYFNSLYDLIQTPGHPWFDVPNAVIPHKETYWTAFTTVFTNTTAQGLNYLTLICDNRQSKNAYGVFYNINSNYIFLDDVSIEDSSNSVILTLPNTNSFIPDLSIYLSPLGSIGTFAGAGVSYNSTTHLWSYDPWAAGGGSHIITFSYNDTSSWNPSLACHQTACSNMQGLACDIAVHFNDTATVACQAKAATIKATVSGGTGHISCSWSSYNGIILSTSANGTIAHVANAANPCIYYITVYDSVAHCTQTFADTIHHKNALVITAGGVHQSSSLPQTLTGYDVIVDSLTTFTVNTPHFTFDSCDVSMGTNAIITINAGDTLDVVHHSYLHACYHLWNGIYVFNSNSRLRMNTGSKLEDARTGAYSWGGGIVELNNCVFNKNVKHLQIRADGYTTGYGGYQKNTLFNCSAALKPALPALPAGITKTLIAIEVDSMIGSATIGDASAAANRNTINNAFCGIYSNQSNLYVYNDSLANIHNGGVISGATYFYAGTGIFARDFHANKLNLTVGSNAGSGNSHCLFYSCDTAITTYRIQPFVYYNTMQNCPKGVHINQLFSLNAEIIHNLLLNPTVGIRVTYVTQNPCISTQTHGTYCPNHVYIQYNTIVQNGGGCATTGVTPYYIGIQHNDVKTNMHYVVDIGQNIIYKPDCGVMINGSMTDYVHDNHISLNALNVLCIPNHSPYRAYGIYASADASQNIQCNDIDATTMPTSYLFGDGVYLTFTNNSQVVNNFYRYRNQGMVSDDVSSTNIQFIRNTLQNDRYGWMRTHNSRPGNQPLHIGTDPKNYNTFTPATGWYNGSSHFHVGYDATTTNTKDSIDAPVTGLASITTFFPIGYNFNKEWQILNTGKINHSTIACSLPYPPPCVPCSTTAATSAAYAYMVANNQISYGEYDSSYHWRDTRELYERMRADSTLISTDSLLQNLYQDLRSGFIGQFDDMITHYTLETANDTIVDTIAIQDLHDQIANLNTDNICEQNLQQFYEIYYRTIAQSKDLGTDDIDALATIANQCPYQGCDGVFLARGLLNLQGDYYYDDSVICVNNGYEYRFAQHHDNSNVVSQTNESIAVKLYPNPTANNFTIDVNQAVNNAYAEVYDIFGKQLYSTILNGRRTIVSCNTCPNGVYVVILKNADGKQLCKPMRLVLMK